jgi:hypothetical protein
MAAAAGAAAAAAAAACAADGGGLRYAARTTSSARELPGFVKKRERASSSWSRSSVTNTHTRTPHECHHRAHDPVESCPTAVHRLLQSHPPTVRILLSSRVTHADHSTRYRSGIQTSRCAVAMQFRPHAQVQLACRTHIADTRNTTRHVAVDEQPVDAPAPAASALPAPAAASVPAVDVIGMLRAMDERMAYLTSLHPWRRSPSPHDHRSCRRISSALAHTGTIESERSGCGVTVSSSPP